MTIDKEALEIALFCCLCFMLYCSLKLIDGVFNHLMPTLFERINQTAQAHKLAAWQAYTPLTLEQLGKEHHTHDKVKEREPEDVMIVHRPTEIMALKHALFRLKFDYELPVERQVSSVVMRWCCICKCRHTLDAFMPDKRTPSGLSFGCRKGRAGLERSVFRIANKGNGAWVAT